MNRDRQTLFTDGQFKDPADCQKSKKTYQCANPECCSEELEMEYGFCGYGLGVFNRCPRCLSVYDFAPEPMGDTDDVTQ